MFHTTQIRSQRSNVMSYELAQVSKKSGNFPSECTNSILLKSSLLVGLEEKTAEFGIPASKTVGKYWTLTQYVKSERDDNKVHPGFSRSSNHVTIQIL